MLQISIFWEREVLSSQIEEHQEKKGVRTSFVARVGPVRVVFV